jgi:1,4-dihydroxy-2-naphthoate octaprenyltransferase
MRSGSVPAHDPSPDDLERLATFGHAVVSWIDDGGYPMSVATGFEADAAAGHVSLAKTSPPIPTDRELAVVGSHINPTPGGYDQRRYVELWGRAAAVRGKRLRFTPTRAWGWDESEVPFFEYSERSVPQSRRYLAALSEEKGRPIRPKLSLFWLALRTTRLPFLSATAVPVLLGIAIAASHGAFTWWTALLTLVGGSLAHLAINVTNDIFDTLSGADDANTTPTQFSGGSRVAIYDLVTIRQLTILAVALFAGAGVIGCGSASPASSSGSCTPRRRSSSCTGAWGRSRWPSASGRSCCSAHTWCRPVASPSSHSSFRSPSASWSR